MTFFASLALPVTEAAAYEFAPIVAEFEPSGPGAARSFVVNNTQSGPVALQIEVFARTSDETGNEVRVPDYDSFIITPPQLVVPPGTSQAIRAQWIGPDQLEREQAYRIIVTQLPIRFAADAREGDIQADVSMGYTYEAAAYVSPRGASPSAELVMAEPLLADDGTQMLRLTIRSTGKKRAILDQPRLKISSSSGGSVELEGERLSALQLKNILSGTQAVIDIPWPEELAFGPVDVQMTTRYFVG